MQDQELINRALKGDPRCPIPIGARIEKVNTEPGDTVQNGHKGYVRGSIYIKPVETPFYFVEWDGIILPPEASIPYIGVGAPRIRRIDNQN